MKVLVCGGRDYKNEHTVYEELDKIHKERRIECLIHGGARGADSFGGVWARTSGVQEVICPANWNVHGKSAGPRRNTSMLLLSPDLVLAFPGGPGTQHMVDIARAKGLNVKRIQEW